MATNQSIYNAFERMWENTQTELDKKADVSHGHSSLWGWEDTRNVSTTPNEYNGKFKINGLKTSSALGTLDSSNYHSLIGFRGWNDSTGGNAHELAFTGNGNIYVRNGATDSWTTWRQILDSENYTNYAATASHNHSASDITSGVLDVARGGTGKSTFTSGAALIGNGTGSITTRAITDNTGSNFITLSTNLITSNTLGYWNGAYNSSGASYLAHCFRGLFGTIVTKNAGDYLSSAGGTVTGTLILSKTTDAAQNADNGPALIIGGTRTAAHIEIDSNEIIAKSNGTTETTLYLGVGTAVSAPGGVTTGKTFYGSGLGSAWNKGRDNAKFRVTSINGYTPGISFKTNHGSWEIGAYDHSSYYDGLLFTYISDDYYANTNTPEAQCFLDTLGAFYSNNLLTTEITFLSNSITPNANWSSGSWITDGWIYLCDTNVGMIQMGADNPDKQGVRFGTAGFTPITNNTYLLGHSSYKWKQLVAGTTTISTSDRNAKKDFKTFSSDERYKQLFMDLKPMIFKFKDGESNRDHFGFVSQDVEDSLLALGFTGESFAGFCKDLKVEDRPEHRGDENFIPILDENGNEQYEYSLRYSEFISLNTYMIQETIKENQELKNKIIDLESRIQKLEGGEK